MVGVIPLGKGRAAETESKNCRADYFHRGLSSIFAVDEPEGQRPVGKVLADGLGSSKKRKGAATVPDQIRAALSRSALATTETDDRLIAAAASIGDRRSPKTG